MIIMLTVPDSALSRELVDTLRDVIGHSEAVSIRDLARISRDRSPDRELDVTVELPAGEMMMCPETWRVIGQLAACELPPATRRSHPPGRFRPVDGPPSLAGQSVATPSATRAIDMSRIWAGTDLWAYDANNVIQISAASKADCLAVIEHISQHLPHYWTQAGSHGNVANQAPLINAARWLRQQPCWQALVTAAAGSNVSPKLFQFLRNYVPDILAKFSPPQGTPPPVAVAAAAGMLMSQKRRIEL